ncbi:MAG: response regulator [Thermoplasmatota archaeon]
MADAPAVLVVDDEPQIRAMLRTLLAERSRFHAHVTEAGSAEDALTALGKAPFDLVISDYRMGKMSGVDLLANAADRFPRTTRILVTAFTDERIAVEAVERGRVDAFLNKPFDNRKLLALVESFLADPAPYSIEHLPDVPFAPAAPAAPASPPAPLALSLPTDPIAALPEVGAPSVGAPLTPEEAEQLARLDQALRQLRVQFGLGKMSAEGFERASRELRAMRADLELKRLEAESS